MFVLKDRNGKKLFSHQVREMVRLQFEELNGLHQDEAFYTKLGKRTLCFDGTKTLGSRATEKDWVAEIVEE